MKRLIFIFSFTGVIMIIFSIFFLVISNNQKSHLIRKTLDDNSVVEKIEDISDERRIIIFLSEKYNYTTEKYDISVKTLDKKNQYYIFIQEKESSNDAIYMNVSMDEIKQWEKEKDDMKNSFISNEVVVDANS